MVAELIDKYIWLIRTLGAAGLRGLKMEELSSRFESRYGAAYPRRTFNNHRAAIEELFGIEIDCHRDDNTYFIAYGREALSGDSAREWLLDTFAVGNLLSAGKEGLSGRVSVENVPSGHLWLTAVMEAMRSGKVLSLEYSKYRSGRSETLTVRPYALKESQKRWYLVGYCEERSALRVYGLDRISSLTALDREFRMPSGFDVDELFAESFGMYLSEPDEVRTIVLRCDETQARFLRDLPVHPTQVETGTKDGMVEFAFRSAPNEALVMEMLKLCGKVEVVSPPELRERIRETIKSSYQ